MEFLIWVVQPNIKVQYFDSSIGWRLRSWGPRRENPLSLSLSRPHNIRQHESSVCVRSDHWGISSSVIAPNARSAPTRATWRCWSSRRQTVTLRKRDRSTTLQLKQLFWLWCNDIFMRRRRCCSLHCLVPYFPLPLPTSAAFCSCHIWHRLTSLCTSTVHLFI